MGVLRKVFSELVILPWLTRKSFQLTVGSLHTFNIVLILDGGKPRQVVTAQSSKVLILDHGKLSHGVIMLFKNKQWEGEFY